VAKPIGNAFIRQNISNANPAGQSNALAIGFAWKFSLDQKRPVTEVVGMIDILRRIFALIQQACIVVVTEMTYSQKDQVEKLAA
jgi:hypothetical protein